MEAIGESIRAIRRSQGRSLEDLAEEAGISFGFLSRLERGEKTASDEVIVRIAEALKVPVRAIVYPTQVSPETAKNIVKMLTRPVPSASRLALAGPE